MSCGGSKCRSNRLEHIEEDNPVSWVQQVMTCPPPETPIESMEFLSRSWSLSAMELSKALSSNRETAREADKTPLSSTTTTSTTLSQHNNSMDSQLELLSNTDDTPISPRGSDEMKELVLLHQVLNQDFLSNQQQLLKNGLYRSLMRGKTTGRWMKDQKERKKQEHRAHTAQLHAAVSAAGVAAAVAALTVSSVAFPEIPNSMQNAPPKTSAAIASAAALVASHCIEIAEEMGADHDQILSVISSAINVRTNGDIMTLTAGAATALRGAATLRTRLQRGYAAANIALAKEQIVEGKESNVCRTLDFISRGGELLKRTRKGDLHWKQVSINVNSNWQVLAKMKSKHIAGTFIKKKKCVVFGVHCDVTAWPGRGTEDSNEERAYFGIQTVDRIIEFECKSKGDKQMWVEGIQYMLHCRANMTCFLNGKG